MGETVPVLELRRVEKRFGRVRALEEVDLTVGAGEFVAVLGGAGAGKSTLVRVVAGLLPPDRGVVSLFGRDVRHEGRAVLASIGFVFDEPNLDLRLTVEGHLRYQTDLQGIDRRAARTLIRRALDRFGLDRAEDRAGALSVADRRKLELARAIVHEPKLLVVDAASDGLAPAARRAMTDPALRLRGDLGTGILWATHRPDEAAVADRIVVLDRGRVAFAGTPAALLGETGAATIGTAFARLSPVTEPEEAAV